LCKISNELRAIPAFARRSGVLKIDSTSSATPQSTCIVSRQHLKPAATVATLLPLGLLAGWPAQFRQTNREQDDNDRATPPRCLSISPHFRRKTSDRVVTASASASRDTPIRHTLQCPHLGELDLKPSLCITLHRIASHRHGRRGRQETAA
jgi:hypothetical protein